MVTASEISDGQGLTKWLEGQPREVSVWLAHRAAMRVAPFAWGPPEFWSHGDFDRRVAVVRLLLLSQIGGTAAPEEIHERVDAALRLVNAVAYGGSDETGHRSATEAANSAQDSAKSARTNDTHDIALYAVSAWHGSHQATRDDRAEQFLRAVRDDAQDVEQAGAVTTRPIWPGENPVTAEWQTARHNFLSDAPTWDFWIRWYEDALAGREPDWALLKEISLIPDEVWQTGAEAVAGAVAVIEERRRLITEVAALKRQLRELQSTSVAVAASPEQRSHNHPPELVEAEHAVQRDVRELVAVLEEAETELIKTRPQPSVLRQVGRALSLITKRIAAYSGELADIAAKQAAEEAGAAGAKWAIGLVGLQLINLLVPLQTLARALADFLLKIAGM